MGKEAKQENACHIERTGKRRRTEGLSSQTKKRTGWGAAEAGVNARRKAGKGKRRRWGDG